MDKAIGNANAEVYMNLYDEIMRRVNSSEVAVAVLHEVGKDSRLRAIQEFRSSSKDNGDADTPATFKQKNYLRSLGVEFDENLSKKEASRLIDANVGEGA